MGYKNIQSYVAIGCLLVIGRVSAYYNQTFGIYSFILSNVSADNSQSRTALVNAQQWCGANGYSLATIPDKDVQNYILQFIQSAVSNSHLSASDLIILNGKLYTSLTPDTWMWVNGQQRNEGVNIQGQRGNEYFFYGFLKTSDYKIHASKHDSGRPYICEYPGNASKCAGGLPLNGRCYQRYTTSLTWYSARNKCLEGGGDLASFETLNDSNFNSTVGTTVLADASATEFWVGIQRAEWRWEDTSLAIKYTNWENGSPFNSFDCLCLRFVYEWLWYTYDCSQKYRFFCKATNQTTTMATSIVTPKPASTETVPGSDLPVPSSSVKHTSTTPISSKLKTNSSGSVDLRLALGLGIGLGVGAIFIAVFVVIVIFCIRRRQKSESRTSFGNSNDLSGLKESAIDASAAEYEEIKNNGTIKDDASIPNVNSGTIYASVQPNGTLLPPSNDANPRGKQIVYAQFDLTPN